MVIYTERWDRRGASEKVLAEMFSLGMTGMRLNLSHVTLAESGDLIGKMKRAAEKRGKTAASRGPSGTGTANRNHL